MVCTVSREGSISCQSGELSRLVRGMGDGDPLLHAATISYPQCALDPQDISKGLKVALLLPRGRLFMISGYISKISFCCRGLGAARSRSIGRSSDTLHQSKPFIAGAFILIRPHVTLVPRLDKSSRRTLSILHAIYKCARGLQNRV